MKAIYETIRSYYTRKLHQYGPQPEGVDWNSVDSQTTRFQQLVKLIDGSENFSINDLGCGYGELISFFNNSGFREFIYYGYDLSPAMVAEARKKYTENENLKFLNIEDSRELNVADYTIASGIFNTKQDHSDTNWKDYVYYTLDQMNLNSIKGFSFNILTRYSDQNKMKADLFYADPCELFDHCKKSYSRNVALLHDYDLYEFTILVRKLKSE